MQYLQELSCHLNQLQVVTTAPPSVHIPAAPSSVNPLVLNSSSKLQLLQPHLFSVCTKSLLGFNQCSINFELAAHHFPTDHSKVLYIVSLLAGDALAWASLLWECQDATISNLHFQSCCLFGSFLLYLRCARPGLICCWSSSLASSMTVGGYVVRFRTPALELA